jgi:Rrf2 family protein
MKFTAKIKYALIFILRLAASYESSAVESVADISAGENIPPKFLEQIIVTLKSKGLIHAQRGSKGGYHLSKDPHEIDLKTIFEAVQGPVLKEETDWPNPDSCVQGIVRDLMGSMKSSWASFLGSRNLGDLLEDASQKKLTAMFYI